MPEIRKSEFNNLMSLLINNTYSVEEGLGFIDVESDEDKVLYAKLIKRTPTIIQEFDIHTQSFVKREIFIFEEISFGIDFKSQTLYAFGALANLGKVKNAINRICTDPYYYSNLELNIPQLMSRLEAQEEVFSLSEIVINRFRYKEGALGRYTAKISNQIIGNYLIKEYPEDVSKVVLNFCSSNQIEYEISLSTNNSISIKCEEDDLYIIIDNFLNLIK